MQDAKRKAEAKGNRNVEKGTVSTKVLLFSGTGEVKI